MSRIVGGDYRIVRPLSEGGMGSVFVAEQISTGKQRALKLMKPEVARDPKFRDRFELEARVGSRIDSEHVVEVVAAGIDEPTGAPWLAMELLDGEDLATMVTRRGGLPLAEVKVLFRQLGHALEKAHAAQIVHRDLKPANLFVAKSRREDAEVTLKVLDFGIAKLVSEAGVIGASTSALGTPLWMSPEQTDTKAPIGPKVDIWAVGLIAHFVLCGRHYWRAAEHNGTLAALMREVLFEPIEAPAIRWPESADRLPTGFDGWFLRCVARDPSQRFASIQDAVRAFLSLEDVGLARTLASPALTSTALTSTALAATAPAPVVPVTSLAKTPPPVVESRKPSSRTTLFRGAGMALVIVGLFVGAYVATPVKRRELANFLAQTESDKETKRIGAFLEGSIWSGDRALGPLPIDADEPAIGAKNPLIYGILFCDWRESCARILKDPRLQSDDSMWPVVRLVQKDAVRRNDPDGMLAAQAGHAVYEAVGATGFVRYRELVLGRLGEVTKSNIVGWAQEAGMKDTAELAKRLDEGRWQAKVDAGGDLAARLHLSESALYGNCEPDNRVGFPGWAKVHEAFADAEKRDAVKGDHQWTQNFYQARCEQLGGVLFARRVSDRLRRSPFASDASEDAARDVTVRFFAAQSRRSAETMTPLVAERVRVDGTDTARADFVATKSDAKDTVRHGIVDVELTPVPGDSARRTAAVLLYRARSTGSPVLTRQTIGLVRLAGRWAVDGEEAPTTPSAHGCADQALDSVFTAPAVAGLFLADLSASDRDSGCVARTAELGLCNDVKGVCEVSLRCHGSVRELPFAAFQVDLETGTISDVTERNRTAPVPSLNVETVRATCVDKTSRQPYLFPR